MPPKRKILWVEDSARFELASVLGPIYASHRYDLTLADNASSAAEYLRRRRYDAIIVDIRLPPGQDRYWLNIYKSAGSDRTNAKLGLALLSWLFADGVLNQNSMPLPLRPEWPIQPTQVGVFSVENRLEVGNFLTALGVTLLYEKRPGLPDTILLDIVTAVLAQVQAPAGQGDHGATA